MHLWPEKYHTRVENFWFSNIFHCFDDGELGKMYTPCTSGQKNITREWNFSDFPIFSTVLKMGNQVKYTHHVPLAKKTLRFFQSFYTRRIFALRNILILSTGPFPRHLSAAGKIIIIVPRPKPKLHVRARMGGVTFLQPHQSAILTWNTLSHVSGNFLNFPIFSTVLMMGN